MKQRVLAHLSLSELILSLIQLFRELGAVLLDLLAFAYGIMQLPTHGCLSSMRTQYVRNLRGSTNMGNGGV